MKGSQEKARREDLELVSIITLSERKRWVQQGRDNSMEFDKTCEDLSWNHCTSTQHRSETNGIAERAVRTVKEGTYAVLLQSGRDEKLWAGFMECYTFLRNVQDLLSDGKTPLFYWLNITLSRRRSSQEAINFERKSYLDCSSDTLCTRVEFGSVTYWSQTLRSWKRWTHRNLLEKTMQRG